MKIERIVKWKMPYGIWFLKIVTNEIAYFGIPSNLTSGLVIFSGAVQVNVVAKIKPKGFPCICRQLCGFVIMTKWSPLRLRRRRT